VRVALLDSNGAIFFALMQHIAVHGKRRPLEALGSAVSPKKPMTLTEWDRLLLHRLDRLGRSVVDMALANQASSEPLRQLLATDMHAVLPPTLATDPDPDTQATLLHRATIVDGVVALDVLLEKGAWGCSTSNAVLRPYCLLCECRVADQVRTPGTDMMARDIVGGTALHAAAGSGATKCVERLLQMDVLGRLLFAEDYDGAVPLHYAAASGHVGVMKALLSAYAQRVGTVDPRDRFGTRRSALCCVAVSQESLS